MNLVTIFISLLVSFALAKKDSNRTPKFISLFNVVKFQNEPCQTQSANGNGFRTGSCITTTECQDRGGMASGACAAGFGACCLFTVDECGGRATQNCTYIRNPGFNGNLDGEAACTYTIEKCSPDVCQFRLDFDTFNIRGPDDATEAAGGECNQDALNINVPGNIIPTICGFNTGQHMFLDVGPNAGATAMLAFTFNGMNTMRIWEIKVTQISCFANCRAPSGCLQWFTGCSGEITTFNFNNGMGNHLAEHCYTSCIRQEEGMCCIKYEQCNEDSFDLDDTMPKNSFIESDCTRDFVIIEGSSASCCIGSGSLTNRYCGQRLHDGTKRTEPIEICDCTPPFEVGFVTDNNAENGALGVGVCLQYTQIPCGIP